MNVFRKILPVFILSFGLMLSCNNQSNQNESNQGQIEDTTSTKQQEVAEAYTCPMHPEVTSDQPGQCPKCGMDLVKKEDNTHTHDDNADSRLGK